MTYWEDLENRKRGTFSLILVILTSIIISSILISSVKLFENKSFSSKIEQKINNSFNTEALNRISLEINDENYNLSDYIIYIKSESLYSIIKTKLYFQNNTIKFTILDYGNITIIFYEIEISKLGLYEFYLNFNTINYISLNQSRLLKKSTLYPTFNFHSYVNNININNESLLFEINIESNDTPPFYYYNTVLINNRMNNNWKKYLIDNRLLSSFEFPMGGSWQLDRKDSNNNNIIGVNIYDIPLKASQFFFEYYKNDQDYLFSLGFINIILYYEYQLQFLNEFEGAVPEFNYWQRISGEIYKPMKTIHIRIIGEIIRQMLYCRRFLNNPERTIVNNSISLSIDFLERDYVFQEYLGNKFWCHDIYEGKKNPDFILNSHTGTIFSLLMAENEGFQINSGILKEAVNNVCKVVLSFDLGLNRISYGYTFLGNPISFTNKSDNYELLIAFDLFQIYNYLDSPIRQEIKKILIYIYNRYTKLDKSLLETYGNNGILFQLSVFLNDFDFFEFYKGILKIENIFAGLTEFNKDGKTFKYSSYQSENQIYLINSEVVFSDINISTNNLQYIILYNISDGNLIYISKDNIDNYLNETFKNDILIIAVFELNGYIEDLGILTLILIIILQLIILSSVIIVYKFKPFSVIKNFNYRLNKRKYTFILILLGYFSSIMFSIFIMEYQIQTFKYSISLYFRRIVNFPNICQFIVIISNILLFSFMLFWFFVVFSDKLKFSHRIYKLLFKTTYTIVFFEVLFSILLINRNILLNIDIFLSVIILFQIAFYIYSYNFIRKNIFKSDEEEYPLYATTDFFLGVLILAFTIYYLPYFIDFLSLFNLTPVNIYNSDNILIKFIYASISIILIINMKTYAKILKRISSKLRENGIFKSVRLLQIIRIIFYISFLVIILIFPYLYFRNNITSILTYIFHLIFSLLYLIKRVLK